MEFFVNYLELKDNFYDVFKKVNELDDNYFERKSLNKYEILEHLTQFHLFFQEVDNKKKINKDLKLSNYKENLNLIYHYIGHLKKKIQH